MFIWIVAIPIGIYSAVRQYSLGDYVFTFVGFIGLAIPNFLLALVLLYVSFRYFGQSVGGLFSPEYVNAPWSLAKVGRPDLPSLDPADRPRHGRHGKRHSHHPARTFLTSCTNLTC